MADQTFWSSPATRRGAVVLALALLTFGVPAMARAQYNAPPLSGLAIGERYHVELAGSLWNPTLVGTVSSSQFGLAGTNLDFTSDFGFQQTRFTDLRFVLRPARKHRLRLQYTPIVYTGDTTLTRTIVFNGIQYPLTLPITSEFDWKVLRFGYEYDFVYRNRGFVGALIEGRYTQFLASLAGGGRSEFASAKAPLPAVGLVARGYVLPDVAINFEVTGFKAPDALSQFKGSNYYDWDVNGTINLTNYVGVQVGWRRMTTVLNIDQDTGNFKFQGLWFGAAVRY